MKRIYETDDPTGSLLLKVPKQEEDLDDYPESIPSSLSPPADVPLKMPKYMEIKCGLLTGRLHTELFICPGIREKCIDTIDNLGVMLTPVEFTIKAEKNKQKDWKGAIKHDGRMLRTLMEFKQLDFHNHHEKCSFKCHSRNYITKNGQEKKPAVPKPVKRHSVPAISKPQPAVNLLQEKIMSDPNLLAVLAAQWNAENHKRQEEAERKMQQKQQAIRNLMENDPATFWNQTIQSRLSSVVINGVSREIASLAHNIIHGQNFESSCVKMNQMLQVLGISGAITREMCGEFILPMARGAPPLQEISPILPIQNPASFSANTNNNNNNNGALSSCEKLELMIKNVF